VVDDEIDILGTLEELLYRKKGPKIPCQLVFIAGTDV